VFYSVLLYVLHVGINDYFRSAILDEYLWWGRWAHWECVAVCCSVLQCTAECCSVLQCLMIHTPHRHLWLLAIRHSRWICVVRPLSALRVCYSVRAVCCSVLQRVAVFYSVLLYVLHVGINDHFRSAILDEYLWCGRWVHSECVAVCCSVLQCVAVYCRVLQCVAVSYYIYSTRAFMMTSESTF